MAREKDKTPAEPGPEAERPVRAPPKVRRKAPVSPFDRGAATRGPSASEVDRREAEGLVDVGTRRIPGELLAELRRDRQRPSRREVPTLVDSEEAEEAIPTKENLPPEEATRRPPGETTLVSARPTTAPAASPVATPRGDDDESDTSPSSSQRFDDVFQSVTDLSLRDLDAALPVEQSEEIRDESERARFERHERESERELAPLNGYAAEGYRGPAVARPIARARPDAAVDRRGDAEALEATGDHAALAEHYRAKIAALTPGAKRLPWLKKLAHVLSDELFDVGAAIEVLMEALAVAPGDEDVYLPLEQLHGDAHLTDLAERVREMLPTATRPAKVQLLHHLVYWYEWRLGRAGDATPLISEIERLDPSHPLVLRRRAAIAAAKHDTKTQVELLGRALERTTRRDEKASYHLVIADALATGNEALVHFEAVIALEPGSLRGLQGIERIGRSLEKHSQVVWALERQVALAPNDDHRTAALLRLAELEERKLLKREQAAARLEEVLRIDPGNTTALRALERCYHALRNWPNLARVLRYRADAATDKQQRVELLELIAEVYESKMNDLPGAAEAYRDLAFVDPHHKRALTDLARIYEKLEDWPNVATYRAKAAAMLPTVRARAQALVQLGELLAKDGRDAMLAELQFEKATTIDPTYGAAWEALQRIAERRGDDSRVRRCLELRAKHSESPRARAQVLLDLAALEAARGSEDAARAAYEAAWAADPTSEVAAGALLEPLLRDERWTDVLPMCDLLIQAARRARDPALELTRQRLATRVSAGLGDAARAMTSALAAIAIDGDDPGAQSDLLSVASQCTDIAHLFERARDALERMTTSRTALPPASLLTLATLQRALRRSDVARQTLEKAIAIDPRHEGVRALLSELAAENGDAARAAQLKAEMARSTRNPHERALSLVEAAELLAGAGHDLDTATRLLEEAQQATPNDPEVLLRLVPVYEAARAWHKLAATLAQLSRAEADRKRRAELLAREATIRATHLSDLSLAVTLFDDALDLAPEERAPFVALLAALTAGGDDRAIEAAYRRMIARVEGASDEARLVELLVALGTHYRERLGELQPAEAAFERALTLRPDSDELWRSVTDIYIITDRIDAAIARTRERLEATPHAAASYQELYELFLRKSAFDRAWCALDVLAQIASLDAEQRRFLGDYPPAPLETIPGRLTDAAWTTHLVHHELDRVLSRALARLVPLVARAKAQMAPRVAFDADSGHKLRSAHSAMTRPLRRAMSDVCEILGVKAPDLFLGEPMSQAPLSPSTFTPHALRVSISALELNQDCLPYLVGRHVAELRPELVGRGYFGSLAQLERALRVGRLVAAPVAGAEGEDLVLARAIASSSTPEELDGLARDLSLCVAPNAAHWMTRAEISSLRAALVIAGDVATAKKAVLREIREPGDLDVQPKLGALYLFAVSDLYADLRGAIGVSIDQRQGG